jgi:hypothetical protein
VQQEEREKVLSAPWVVWFSQLGNDQQPKTPGAPDMGPLAISLAPLSSKAYETSETFCYGS